MGDGGTDWVEWREGETGQGVMCERRIKKKTGSKIMINQKNIK